MTARTTRLAACAVFLLAYVVALIAMVPATWVDAALARASAGTLRLAEARGTLWAGAGELEVRDAAGKSGFAQAIAWRFTPGTLLRGRAGFEVALGPSARSFPMTLGASGFEIANANVDLPAAALGLAVPQLAPLRLTGDFSLHVARLSFAAGKLLGDATLQWRSAGSAASRVPPLGDYELRLEGKGALVEASLRTLQGTLQLEGRGSWAIGSRPVFSAIARIAPQYREQLAPLLYLIAVERGDGSFELQLK